MASPIFLAEVPHFEIRDGMVFVAIDGQPSYCASVHTLRAAVAQADRLLRALDAQPPNIFPACICCEKRPH